MQRPCLLYTSCHGVGNGIVQYVAVHGAVLFAGDVLRVRPCGVQRLQALQPGQRGGPVSYTHLDVYKRQDLFSYGVVAEVKQVLYDSPYPNKEENIPYEGFLSLIHIYLRLQIAP